MLQWAMTSVIGLPIISLEDVAAASLSLAIRRRFEKETYQNDDLIRLGQEYLKEQGESSTSS